MARSPPGRIPAVEEDHMRSLDFFLDAANGGISGLEHVRVFGQNPDVDTGTDPEDVWDGEGLYNYTAAAGAPYFISSSNAGDTIIVSLTLLTKDSGGDWNEETFNVTLVGQTKTAITSPSGDVPVRLQSIVNATGTPLLGDVYVYEDCAVVAGVPADATKIRGKVLIGNDRTLMALYTVPSGKTAYLYGRDAGIVSVAATTMDARFYERESGGLFTLKQRAFVNNAILARYEDRPAIPRPIAAKTDIRATAFAVTVDNTAVVAEFDLLLLG
jgi:hypothetical protein